jgi:hypothetical protein
VKTRGATMFTRLKFHDSKKIITKLSSPINQHPRKSSADIRRPGAHAKWSGAIIGMYLQSRFVFSSSTLTNLPFRPPLKTYSKRVLQDSYKPPEKRQRIESRDPSRKLADCKTTPSLPPLKKKRSIVDYFKASTHSSSPSPPSSLTFSPTSLKSRTDTPPSSPPPPIYSLSVEPCKNRRRRKLTTRPALKRIEMSTQGTPNGGNHRDIYRSRSGT